MQWYRPMPAAASEVTWSARDNLNYQETGALMALDYTAGHSKAMLRNFYKKAWDSWQKGLTQPPYAFLIPQDQGDPARVAQMVGRLIGQHIEVAEAQSAIQAQRRQLSGGHLRGSPRPALSQLRGRSAHAAALSERWRASPTMTFPGNCRRNYHLQAIPTADASIRAVPL